MNANNDAHLYCGMSKYNPLWEYIKTDGADTIKLTYAEIEEITGFPIDHSFLTFRKELSDYGIRSKRYP